MSYYRHTSAIIFNYKVEEEKFGRCTLKRDLGILLDSRLTFDQRIINISPASNKIIGLVIRNMKSL